MMMSLIGEATPLSLKMAAILYSAANRMLSLYGNIIPQSQVRREGEGGGRERGEKEGEREGGRGGGREGEYFFWKDTWFPPASHTLSPHLKLRGRGCLLMNEFT